MIRILRRGPDGSLDRDDRPDSKALEFAADDRIWVDMLRPNEAEQQVLTRVFHFHPLAVEDALVDTHHPKIDEYPDYLYIVIHSVNYLESDECFVTAEVDVFLGKNFLVTIHDEHKRSIDYAYQRICEEPRLMDCPDRLLHAILDRMVDNFFPELEKLDDRIDRLETATIQRPDRQLLNDIFQIKRDVSHLKRIVAPQREVFNRLSRDETQFIAPATRLYFRDIYDNLFRMTDIADSYRDLLTGMLDAYLSSVSNNLNEVMKVLTILTTVFIPFTAVSGIFGMNFPYIPGAASKWGFYGAIVFMVVLSSAMLYWFRKRRWF
ncbi:MAG TPA: magnesium/cobalt transporter CorA [Acidobacteriota bacterium]|jgi:magnesium transporter